MVNSLHEEGRLRGQRQLLRKMLEKKFGPLPPLAIERWQLLTQEQIEEMGLAMLDASSLQDLGLSDALPTAESI